MTSQSNPFDDPEIRRAMAEAGVVHRPGLAAEVLEQLSPLLADEGIDLDNLGDIDEQQLDAAMARAVERHNLTLFTPIGRHREQSLAVLRAVAEALAEGEPDAAVQLLRSVPSDPTELRPAVSHVTGLCLGLIDSWEPDAALQSRMRRRRLPKMQGRRVANDLLAVGLRRRAFDSLDSFIVKHGGEALLQGAALAAAASVVAVAEHDRVEVAQALAALVGTEIGELAEVSSGGTAFGIGARPEADEGDEGDEGFAAARFGQWLERQYGRGNPIVEAQLQLVDGLLSIAVEHGFDPRSPGDIAALAEMVFDAPDADARADGLDGLLDYAHFRFEDSVRDPEWAVALDQIQEALGIAAGMEDDADLPSVLLTAIDDDANIPQEQREAALAKVRPLAAVPQLLDWLGRSKPITATGGLRRADIAPVAAMLGIRAEGVASLPPVPEPGTVHVTSMRGLAPLDAWWEALTITEVILLTPSRAQPGPAVPETGERLAPQTAEMLVSAFVAQLVTHTLNPGASTRGERSLTQLVLARVEELLDPELDPDDSVVTVIRGDTLRSEVAAVLKMLQDAGVLTEVGGRLLVPEPLRGVVARGLLVAHRYVLMAEDDEF